MAPQTATRMTYEEFMALPVEKYRRVELIEGELVVNPAPLLPHQSVVGNLYFRLRAYLEQHGGGRAYLSPIDVVFSREHVLQPDVIVIRNDRTNIIRDKKVQGAPDIVIEVFSQGTRRSDQTVKRRLYEQFGVPEYWMVDPEELSVTIIRNGQETVVTDTITTPLLPGFALPLRDVFADQS